MIAFETGKLALETENTKHEFNSNFLIDLTQPI